MVGAGYKTDYCKASGVFVEQKLTSGQKTRSPFAPGGRKWNGKAALKRKNGISEEDKEESRQAG